MSHTVEQSSRSLVARLLGFARRLLPGASAVALDVVAKATGAVDAAPGLSLVALAGFSTVHEFVNSWHSLHLGVWANRKHDAEHMLDVDDDRRYNKHLAAAVGITISDILRSFLPSVPRSDEGPIESLIAKAPELLKSVVESGFAPDQLDDQELPAVVESAVQGRYEAWGDLGMWKALLKVMAENVSVIPSNESLEAAAEACRREFVQRFFATIKTDLQTKGQAFASIHFRMLTELLDLARATGKTLDALLALIARQGNDIDLAARMTPESIQVAELASELNRRIARRFERVEHIMHEGTRSTLAATKSEGIRTRWWATRTAIFTGTLVVLFVLTGTYVASRFSLKRSAEHHREEMAVLVALLDQHRRLIDAGMSIPPFPSEDIAVAKDLATSTDPFVRAIAAIVASDFARARHELKANEGLMEQAFTYLTIMGDSYYFEGNYDDALPWYERAIDIPGRENDLAARIHLALTFQQCRRGDIPAQIDRAIALHEGIVRSQVSGSPEWARTWHNLGVAWEEKPTGTSGENIDKAIKAYTDALSVFTKPQFPAEWATTHNNLANAWRKKPTGDKAQNIQNAFASIENALTVRTRDRYPVQWAVSQTSLGNAWQDKPNGNKRANIDNAIAAYTDALTILTQQGFPEDWAATHNNLGVAWRARQSVDSAQNIDKAIASFEAALTVRTRDRYPLDWAMTQTNLGCAWQDKLTGDRPANIELALEAHTNALTILTLPSFPYEWSAAQHNLGNAWRERLRGDKADNVEKAIAAFDAALIVRTRDRFPVDWAMTTTNLGSAWLVRPTGDPGENIDKAITAYLDALSVFDQQHFPADWAVTQNNLGNAWLRKPTGDPAENIENAIKAYGAALTVFTRERSPARWAITRYNMGELWLQKNGPDRRSDLREAIRCYEDALEIWTAESYPNDHADAITSLERAREELRELGGAQSRDRLPHTM